MNNNLNQVEPVLSKTLTGNDAYFDGKYETFSSTAGPQISGAITYMAKIKIASWEDLTEGFHYIIGQNNGDNTKPENFLRIRRKGNRAIFECGSWVNPVNHEIGADIDPNKHIGKDLFIIGFYDSAAQEWGLSVNGEIVRTSDQTGAVAVEDAFWVIGKHDFTGKERYFKGYIYYAAVFNQTISFKLLTDSDNNGYITDPSKNAEAAKAEYRMGKTTPKPLTYFPQLNLVPDACRHVALKIDSDVGNVTYKFSCTENLEIAVKVGTAYTLVPDGTALDLTQNYFVRAKSADAGKKENNLDKVRLIMSSGTTEIAEEFVTFDAQKTLDDWIVPSGWKIEGNTITTIVPVEGAVAPKSEGSDYDDAAKRGYTFSVNTYKSGFKLTLKYSFTRNGVNGYLQPDRNGNEKIDPSEAKKLSFVGNSGIKLGGFTGAKEVAIFDTQAMVDRVSVTDGGVTFTGIEAFKHRPPTTPDTGVYTGVPMGEANKVLFIPEFTTNKDNTEKLTQLLNGIRYNGNLSNFYDYVNADGSMGTWQKLYNTLVNNYNRWQGTADKELEIYWKPSEVGQTQGTLEVYAKINGQWLKYYDESGVEISNGGSLDGRIYIQTHWGSGVKFKEISIGPWTLPPVPPTN
ncbi:MAG: hypothetical protein LBJ00_16890 [Planctomycetaceae bacterium]|jgi:hypothetical protein|nr:hypothetical protein [Planctomycetaceae bacterium]